MSRESFRYESSLKRFLLLVVPCLVLSQAFAFGASAPGLAVHQLPTLAAFCVGVQWLGFAHASGLVLGNPRTERYYDLTGALTFLSASYWSSTFIASSERSLRQRLVTACVQVWALRLGSFLFSRINKHGGTDNRFTEIKPSLLRFFGAWTIQGVWVFLTALPVFALNQSKDLVEFGTVDFVGLGLWGSGLAFEIVADFQKSKFKEDPKNDNKFISNGLWSLCRHPNYLGEITLWIGLCLCATHGMPSLSPRSICSCVSPVFVTLLLLFVSGIPMLEKASNAKWGHLKSYQEFKAKVPVLIPLVGRRGDAPF